MRKTRALIILLVRGDELQALFKHVSGRAIGYGSLIFLVMYMASRFLVINISWESDHALMLLNAILYCSWTVCGYLTAAIGKKAGALNGVILGLIVPFILVIFDFLKVQHLLVFKYFIGDYPSQAFVGIITCGLGGLIWDIKSRLSKSVSP